MGEIQFPKWLCECGEEAALIEEIEQHCHENGHIAEYIGEDGNVKKVIAAGLNEQRYSSSSLPDSAQIDREALKNEPLFDKTA